MQISTITHADPLSSLVRRLESFTLGGRWNGTYERRAQFLHQPMETHVRQTMLVVRELFHIRSFGV